MADVLASAHGFSAAASSEANRLAWLAAHAACSPGDRLIFGAGTFFVATQGFDSLPVTQSITLRGAGRDLTKICIDPALTIVTTPRTWRMLNILADNVIVEDICFDGQKPNSDTVTVYDPNVEQHKGIFIGPDVDGCILRRLRFSNFQGDGFQLYNGVTNTTIHDIEVRHNQRSGFSFTPTDPDNPVVGVTVTNYDARGVTVQSIDNEHGAAYDVDISNSFLSSGLNSFCITISGYSDIVGGLARSKRWHIHDLDLEGGIFAIRCDDVLIERIRSSNPTTKACVEISRSVAGLVLRWSRLTMTQTDAVDGIGVVRCIGSDDSFQGGPTCPSGIRVFGNRLQAANALSFGVQIQATDDIDVVENEMYGPNIAAAGYAGVYVRATIGARAMQRVRVHRNRIRNWGQRGVSFLANQGEEVIEYAEVLDNDIANSAPGGPMTTGIRLDDGTQCLQKAYVAGNIMGAGVSTPIANGSGVADLRLAAPPTRVRNSGTIRHYIGG